MFTDKEIKNNNFKKNFQFLSGGIYYQRYVCRKSASLLIRIHY